MVKDGFTEGVLVTLVGSAVVGLVARQVLFALGSVRSFFKPQVVTQKTDKSPAQVASGCAKGLLTLALLAALVGSLVVLWLSGRVRVEIIR